MKINLSSARKEFRQVRWFLFWGLVIFLVFPLLEAITSYQKGHAFRTDMPEGIVLFLGGFFAIFTAVGIVCPELKKGLLIFWRSKPIAIWKWILLKYAVGLFVILIVCIIPIIMELVLHRFASPNRRQDFVYTVLNSHTFTIILIYSLSFLISCLIRKTTHAAILSLALMLLIYFLPVLVPPLEGFSIINLLFHFETPFRMGLAEAGNKYVGEGLFGASNHQWGYSYGSPKMAWLHLPGGKALIVHYISGYFLFILTMLAISLISVVLSALAIKRNWRVKMGQKLLCWSLGVVVLLIFSTIAFTVGSNLKCQKMIELKYVGKEVDGQLHHGILNSVIDGNKGLCVGLKTKLLEQKKHGFYFFTFGLDNDTANFSGLTYLDNKTGDYWLGDRIAWSAENPDIVWMLTDHSEDLGNGSKKGYRYLVAFQLNEESKSAVEISKLELANYISTNRCWPSGNSFVLYENTIYAYVYGKYLQIDAKDPFNPKIMKTKKYGSFFGERGSDGKDCRTFELIPDNNLSPQERLNIAIGLIGHPMMAIEQNLLVSVSRDYTKVYKLNEIKDGKAEFERISYRQPTPLERIDYNLPSKVMLKNGLAYIIQQGGLGRGLTVFDVTQPGLIRKIGHYNRPEELFKNISYIDDDKVILLGRNIHILKPPKSANH
jgi:ABC-type transport system involved in multi-copper enzyme maturation permease subunit